MQMLTVIPRINTWWKKSAIFTKSKLQEERYIKN